MKKPTHKTKPGVLLRFGKAVRERRLTLGLSQEQLAHVCELDRSYVGGVERGDRNISLVNIAAIASGLQLSASKLLRLSEEEEK